MAEFIITGDSDEHGAAWGAPAPVLVFDDGVTQVFRNPQSISAKAALRYPDQATAVSVAERISGKREVCEVTVVDRGNGDVTLTRTARPPVKTTKRTPFNEVGVASGEIVP